MPRRAPPVLALLLTVGATAGSAVDWQDITRQRAEWYARAEATAIAGSIAQYQTPEGGWSKNTDMTRLPTKEFLADTKFDHRAPTIDNGATTTQLQFLAQVLTAAPDETLQAVFFRGFDYLLAAQYENGGWPQYFPLIKGYYSHITYNDNAMINVLTVLRAASRGEAPYEFVDAARRARAAAAVAKGVGCILRTQVKQQGRRLAWCAQHDEFNFLPAWARNFEPPSLSGSESVGIVKFLMGVEKPSPDVIAAVEGAVAWFQEVGIRGVSVDNHPGPDGQKDRHVVGNPAGPVLWARFYELGTNRPIFLGRDKVVQYDFNAIERERRTGYNYLSDWPADLLAKDYPRWRAKNKLP
ncbi:MAG: pectate lyase [bacterium]|nr:pectate lyase [bacterium]